MKNIVLFLLFLLPFVHLDSQTLEMLAEKVVFEEDTMSTVKSYKYFMSLLRDQRLETSDINKFNGVAISPEKAANCMLESKRTQAFTRALYLAAKSLEKEHIKILYVGCGPLAPFMTLTAPLLPNARYSLVEISENSAETAKILINRLGLNSQLDTLIMADATEMKVPNGKEYDIIITETMYAGLNSEMMIPILINILPQLKENVLLIPEDVELELIVSDKSNKRQKLAILEIFTASELLRCFFEDGSFPSIGYASFESEVVEAFIGTRVKVFKDIYLHHNESIITKTIKVELVPEKSISFSYSITPPRLLINDDKCD